MADQSFQRVGVIGGGAWGTALAHTMAQSGRNVRLWAYEADTVREINEHRTNRVFLAGVRDRLNDCVDALSNCTCVGVGSVSGLPGSRRTSEMRI